MVKINLGISFYIKLTYFEGKLVVMEDRESGSVGWDVYYEYIPIFYIILL